MGSGLAYYGTLTLYSCTGDEKVKLITQIKCQSPHPNYTTLVKDNFP